MSSGIGKGGVCPTPTPPREEEEERDNFSAGQTFWPRRKLPGMRSLTAFLAINGLFIAMNAAFAVAIIGVFKLVEWLWPDAMEQPLVVLALGSAVTVAVLWAFKSLTSRKRGQS